MGLCKASGPDLRKHLQREGLFGVVSATAELAEVFLLIGEALGQAECVEAVAQGDSGAAREPT